MTIPLITAATALALNRARDLLAAAQRVLVVTGAGISRSAGVQTYVDLEQHDPEQLRWLRSDEHHLHADPCPIWRALEERRQHMLRVPPTAAHRAIARWATTAPRAAIVTQNVDGLHERAALAHGHADDVARIHCLHGTLLRGRCTRCGRLCDLPDTIDCRSREHLPHSTCCRKLVRPAIVWFGERIPTRVMKPVLRLAVSAEVCLVIGTRLDVFPAGDLPAKARSNGAHLIEVNPTPALPEHPSTISIPLPADLAVPALLDGLRGSRGKSPGIDPASMPVFRPQLD